MEMAVAYNFTFDDEENDKMNKYLYKHLCNALK